MTAKAGLVLDKAGIPYARELPSPGERFDVALIGTDCTAVMFQCAAKLHGIVNEYPVIELEDFPGCGNYYHARRNPATFRCVADKYALAASKNVSPNLGVKVVGNPSYAMNVGPLIARKKEIRAAVRAKLGILDSTFVLMHSHDDTMQEMVQPLEALIGVRQFGNRETVILPRFHPKTPTPVREAADHLIARAAFTWLDTRTVPYEEVALASDAILCPAFSTVQFTGALAEIPVVLQGFPDMTPRFRELGYLDGVPPLVASGVGAIAPTPNLLLTHLEFIAEEPETAKRYAYDHRHGFASWIDPESVEKMVHVVETMLALH